MVAVASIFIFAADSNLCRAMDGMEEIEETCKGKPNCPPPWFFLVAFGGQLTLGGAFITSSVKEELLKGDRKEAAILLLIYLVGGGAVVSGTYPVVSQLWNSPEQKIQFLKWATDDNTSTSARNMVQVPIADIMQDISEEVAYFDAFAGRRTSLTKESFLYDAAKATGIEVGRLHEILKRAGSFGDHALNGELIAEQVTHASPVDLVRLTANLSEKERTLAINYLKMRNLV